MSYFIGKKCNSLALISVLFLMVVSFTKLNAQSIGITETIDFINKKLEGYCELEDKRKYINVDFFKNGKVYRTDRLHTDELDYETIEYSIKEKGFLINCRESAEKCIERKIPHLKIVDNYDRILFLYEGDEKEINALKDALTHLVKLAYFSDLNRIEPFE